MRGPRLRMPSVDDCSLWVLPFGKPGKSWVARVDGPSLHGVVSISIAYRCQQTLLQSRVSREQQQHPREDTVLATGLFGEDTVLETGLFGEDTVLKTRLLFGEDTVLETRLCCKPQVMATRSSVIYYIYIYI